MNEHKNLNILKYRYNFGLVVSIIIIELVSNRFKRHEHDERTPYTEHRILISKIIARRYYEKLIYSLSYTPKYTHTCFN